MDNPSTPSNAGGNNMGKESTGNSAPFPFAFEMIAAIAVIPEAMHILSVRTMAQNNNILPTCIEGKKKRNNPAPVNDKEIERKPVKSNFPKNTSMGVELSLSNNEVPLSSSITNVRDKPVMLPKNNTIHNSADAMYELIFSPAVVNEIVEIVITMNNSNAESAMRERNSIAISLRNTAMLLLNALISFNLRYLSNDHNRDLLKIPYPQFAMYYVLYEMFRKVLL